jgi:RND family efflux transporter MFP subunit
VTAPFDGVVVRRWHNPGDLVDASASDPILRFADPARTEVEALVPATAVPRISAGESATVSGPSGARWTATVARTPPSVDATTNSAHVRLTLGGQGRPALGLPVEATIVVSSHDAPVAVPAQAILRQGDRTSVFVIADGKAVRREVVLGLISNELVEIAKGVRAGEDVVTSGTEGLTDGAKVSVAP